jgi:hypothetical protein
MYATAMDAWNFGMNNHPGDVSVPKDFPAYFGPSPTRTDANKNAGDIVLSLGDGRFVCTDGAGGGVIGIMTLAQRAAQISRPYLGWGEEQCGYLLTTVNQSSTSKGSVKDMGDLAFIKDARSATIFLQNNATGKRVGIQSPYHVGLLTRAIAGDGGMLIAEMDIVNSYEAAIASQGAAVSLTDAQLATIAAAVKVPESLNIELTGKAVI